MTVLGGVELGGTKCIAAVGTPEQILDRLELPTRTPGETLPALTAWLAERRPAAIGVASFGPVGLDRAAGFGRLALAPKPGWDGADVLAPFAALAPARLDTDVAAAGMAEAALGAAQGARLTLYLTVGTGIGGAWLLDGAPLHARNHPELGHIRLPRAGGDGFPGICPLHGDCAEGLASGPAIAAHAGRDGADLPDDHPALAAAVDALGALVAGLLLTLPADAVVLGGGVITGRPALVPRIADAGTRALGGYPPGLDVHARLRLAALGRDAGVAGALMLARAESSDRD